MERQVRYCTTEDGVRIAYCVEGDGPALVVLSNFVDSFAMDHIIPGVIAFYQQLAAGRTLIRLDNRGVGLSQRKIDDFSLAAGCIDVKAVLAAAGLRRAAIFASTASVHQAIGYAANYPDDVSALVFYGGYACPSELMPAASIMAFASLWRANPITAAQTFADLAHREFNADIGVPLARIYRESIDPEDAARLLEAAAGELRDARPLLGQVRARTLVIHRREDILVPFSLGQAIAQTIPNARLSPLDGKINYFPIENPEEIVRIAIAFLDEDPETRRTVADQDAQVESQGAFRAVLFTDLVGHTTMMRRLGDEKGRAVLREHEEMTREVLKSHGGTEVKTMGDGFMASFSSVTKAVECAITLQ